MNTIGSEHFSIHLIKKFPCNAKEELESEEYKIMKEMQAEGVELYNTYIDGHSEETKKKLTLIHNKGGCIGYQNNPPRWVYQCTLNGKK
jgi:hypothetical protein